MNANEMNFRLAIGKKTIEDIKSKHTKKIKIELLKKHYDFFKSAAEGLEMDLDDYMLYFFYQKTSEAIRKVNIANEKRLARDN